VNQEFGIKRSFGSNKKIFSTDGNKNSREEKIILLCTIMFIDDVDIESINDTRTFYADAA